MSMRMILLGGAPGIGKTATARECLRAAIGGTTLVQWVDVDALWAHQPWRVDEAMTTMVRANLRAVIGNAAEAGVDVLLVTWVFQDASFHRLLDELAPDGVRTTTVQLRSSEATWRTRFSADPDRPPIDAFYTDRYRAAQATPADHVIETDDLDAPAVARAVAAVIETESKPRARR
jgi:predicted kinase